ncbi:unnamed protein product [Urochloa humidicola]
MNRGGTLFFSSRQLQQWRPINGDGDPSAWGNRAHQQAGRTTGGGGAPRCLNVLARYTRPRGIARSLWRYGETMKRNRVDN